MSESRQDTSVGKRAGLEDADERDEAGEARRVPAPPVSGVRTRSAAECICSIRKLARAAEATRLESLAFELFFAAARIEATGKVDFVRGQLEEIAELVTELEARVYRRAVRLLSEVVPE